LSRSLVFREEMSLSTILVIVLVVLLLGGVHWLLGIR
jgi:hypothetical protein